MKLDELRAALGKYDDETIKKIAVELYKMIPRAQKENNNLDEYLLNYTQEKNAPAKKDAPVNFNELKPEIERFLDYAYMQYYFAPNKHVRKEKRSKWRFEVKRFIKDLIRIGGENSEEAGDLLVGIYNMLSYGCNYYIFSTENPFSSVGYEQTELLALVLNKIFYSGFTKEAIKKAVFLTLDSNVNPNTIHMELMYVFTDILKTTDTKEAALEQCVAYRNEYDLYQDSKKIFKYAKTDGFRRKEHKNQAVDLYLMIKISLHEYDEGILYYWLNAEQGDREIKLYRLLVYFLGKDEEKLISLWIREYEKAVATGVKPREYLQKEYEKRKEKQV